MSKYKSDVDHLDYRVDLIERRLEKIEDLLMAGNNGKNNNQEVITLLLNMVKQQYTPSASASASASASTYPKVESEKEKDKDKEKIEDCDGKKTDSFNLRRLSMVL